MEIVSFEWCQETAMAALCGVEFYIYFRRSFYIQMCSVTFYLNDSKFQATYLETKMDPQWHWSMQPDASTSSL
jgi:hypothetical protein